jgi:hypothetical protein
MYNEYIEYLSKNISDITSLNFKSSDKYCSILEHVSQEHGKQYLKLIEEEFPYIIYEQIVEFININDKIGFPNRYTFFNKNNAPIICSPTSLRYIYHALVILQHYLDFF